MTADPNSTPAVEKKSVPEDCPCESGAKTADCCGPFVAGKKKPETAEQLMRSRYCAFVLGNVDYIMKTHHPSTVSEIDRKGVEAWSKSSEWKGLEIVDTQAGGKDDDSGEVEFIAKFGVRGLVQTHHERAEFKRDKGRWFFVDGKQIGSDPVVRDTPRIGRNDPCSCGSGKKYKKCCGKAG